MTSPCKKTNCYQGYTQAPKKADYTVDECEECNKLIKKLCKRFTRDTIEEVCKALGKDIKIKK